MRSSFKTILAVSLILGMVFAYIMVYRVFFYEDTTPKGAEIGSQK